MFQNVNLRVCLMIAAWCGSAHANGRAPLTNRIQFDRADPHALYVGSTFGLLISHDDGCTLRWVCEANLGYAGTWDPKYAIGTDGAIYATTFTGLEISRDGGCTFAMATAELPKRAHGRIADKWIDAIDLGPTGDLWVGTAISGAPNEVYVSHDAGASFAPVGLESPRIFWKSVRVAPSNLSRVYVTGYEVAPPTAHLEVSRDLGHTWTASPLTGVAFGATPIVLVAAVDLRDPDTLFVTSVGASGAGDRLYRTRDAGRTFQLVLDPGGAIGDVVVRDDDVYVATLRQSGPAKIGGPAFHSRDGGVTFEPIAGAPPLACLGIAPDGDVIGCAPTSLVRSHAGGAWTPIWRFGELAGPLACPAGTPEHDRCNAAEIKALSTTEPVCRPSEPSEAGTDDGRARLSSRAPARVAAPSKGCDAGGEPGLAMILLVVIYARSRQLG